MAQEKLTIEDNERVNALFKQMSENPNLVSEQVFEDFSELKRRINTQFVKDTDPFASFEEPSQKPPEEMTLMEKLANPPPLELPQIEGVGEPISGIDLAKSAATGIEPLLAAINIPIEIVKRSILDIKKGEINFKQTIVKPFLMPFVKGSVFGEFTADELPPSEDRITTNVLEQIGIGEGPSIEAPDFMKKIGIKRFTTRGLFEFGLEALVDVVVFGNIAKIFKKAKLFGVNSLDDAERAAMIGFGEGFEELTSDKLREAADKFKQVFGQDIEDISSDIANLRRANTTQQQDDIVETISNKLFNNRQLLSPDKRNILSQEVKQISKPLVIDSNTRISSSEKPIKKATFDIKKETTYNGKQVLDDKVAKLMGFKEADIYTDKITRSTFTVRPGESVETELMKVRKRFGIKAGGRQVDFNSLFENEKNLANELVAASSGFVSRDAAANIVRGIDVEENILKSVNSKIKDIAEHNKVKDTVFDEITQAIQNKLGIKVDRKKLPYSIDAKSVDIDDVPLTKKGASIPDPYKTDNPGKTGFGSGNKVFTKAKKDKALSDMTKDLNKLNSGLDPNDFIKFVNIGGYYIEGGLRAFGPWSHKMVDELGSFIRPHLKKIWNELKSKHKKAFSAIPGVSGQEKRVNAKLNQLFEVPTEPFRDKLKRGFIMMQEMLDNRFVVVSEMEKVVEQTLNIKLPFDMRPSRMLQLASGRFGAAEPSLNVLLNIQRGIPKNLGNDFSKYMIAERVVELSGRGFQKVIKDLNLTIADAQTILGQLKRNLSKDELNIFKGLSEEYRRLLKEDGLNVLLSEGIISSQLYDNVIKLNKKYMPFHVLNRFADGNYLSRVFGSGTFNVKSQDIIKPITGAIKGIDPDPFRRGEKILYRIYDIISRNRVARMVGSLADSPGYETFIIKPKKKTSSIPEGFKEIFWLEKGVKQRVFVDSDVQRVLMLLQEDQFSRAQRILAKMAGAQVLRLGATGANLGFAFRNVLRDPQNAAILARHGLSGHAYIRAIAESFNRGDLWDLWARSGGRFATAASQLERNFIDLGKVSKSDFNKGMLNAISVTGEQILKVIDNSETITRLNIFQTDLEHQLGRAGFKDLMQAIKGKRGKFFDLPKDMQMAIYNASWESRDYIDFARSGSFLKHVNMFAPYLNADAQGKSKMIRFALDDPEKFFRRVTIGSLAVTSIYAWNSMFESFNRVPPWMRDNSIIFMYGQYTDTGGELHPLYFRIPKGDVLKVLVNPMENFLDFATKDKDFKKALLESAGDLWENLVPRYISDPGSVAPPTMKAMAEWQSNYSFFKNTKVSPDLIGGFPRSAKHQFYDYTTETSKMIGKFLNVPPAKLDNLVQNLTGGLGKEMLEAIDRGLFLFGAIEERPNVMKREGGFVRQIPFLSQFFVDYAIPANNLDFELLQEARKRAGDRITENYRIASKIFEQLKENKKFEDRIFNIEKGKISEEIIDIVKRMSKNNILNIGRFETFLADLPVIERAWFIAQKLQEIEDIQMQKAYLVSLSSSTGKILTKETMIELNKILPSPKNSN